MQPSGKPGDSTTRTKRRQFWFVALAVAALGVSAVAVYWSQPDEMPLDRFKRHIRSELPVGASRAEVDSWVQQVQGKTNGVTYWPANSLPAPPQRTIPEVAGVPRADLKSFVEIVLPWGQYEINEQTTDNHLWVFLTLDEHERIKGHYFLTLAELADYEKRQNPMR